MKLVVGLGNPGPEYRDTKHNVGFWVIDAFAEKYEIPINKPATLGRGVLVLCKPQTFMNRSGGAVVRLLEKFRSALSDLIVIQDDLDMECGKVRIRTDGGAGGHRGIASIIEHTGSDKFLRIKIGIGRDLKQEPSDYVLTPFSKEDKQQVLGGISDAVSAIPLLIEGKIAEAKNQIGAKTP
ncbi:MAG: aminoacyl-tRNA hydrolase [Nitrospirae bacterium]|nr:aminoacyl-tRNA hydrolase [Candidatus Troglogloeales bacterium]MBI3597966.1 aminoacyl-tRNA hydrolase [Candidatus Troglogloeales bacterium]